MKIDIKPNALLFIIFKHEILRGNKVFSCIRVKKNNKKLKILLKTL